MNFLHLSAMFKKRPLALKQKSRNSVRKFQARSLFFESLERREYLSASGFSPAASSSYVYSSQPTANLHQAVTIIDEVFGRIWSGSGASSPSGTVSFRDNGNLLGTVNLTTTPYGYSVAKLTTSSLAPGSHSISAFYNGSSSFSASSSTTGEFINSARLLTSSYLSSSQPVANMGQSLVFNDYVYGSTSSSLSPSGTVSFYDNNSLLGTTSLSTTSYGYSKATWTTSDLPTGNHSIKAVYNGSSSFSSSSAMTTETINQAQLQTTSYLSTSKSIVDSGQSVTFSDYVYGNYYATSAPSGTISFFDNGRLLGTAPLTTYVFGTSYATLTTSTLPAGAHSITATYNGNSNFRGSSAVVSQTINQTQSSDLTPGEAFTLQQEGGAQLHPYHPSAGSGVTIGVGYDIGQRSSASVFADLTAAGVDSQVATKVAAGAGLIGQQADAFVARNASLTLTYAQAMNLYLTIYNDFLNQVKTICSKADVVQAYGATNWAGLNQKIKDVLVDMIYRGDYHPTSRVYVQPYVVANNVSGFSSAMTSAYNIGAFGNLSYSRFQSRVSYLRG